LIISGFIIIRVGVSNRYKFWCNSILIVNRYLGFQAAMNNITSPVDKYFKHLRKGVGLFLLLTVFTCPNLLGQIAEFVPEGVNLATVDTTRKTYDGYLNATSGTSSALGVYLNRNGVSENDIDGSISYEKTTVQLLYQYGLFKSVNLGITIPHIQNKRNSNISVIDVSQSDFADSIDSAESSGFGDIKIWGLWRAFYTDQADFQLGLTLKGDNAPLNSDSHDKMPLGNGSKELTLFLRSHVYSIQSSLKLSLEVQQLMTESIDIKLDDGQTATITQSNSLLALLGLSSNSGAFRYGGGLKMESIGNQKLDGVSQQNGYLSYALRGLMAFGNLNLLEHQSISNPWEARLEVEKVFSGSNAPDSQSLSISVLTYF